MDSEQIRGAFRVISTIRALFRPGDAGRSGAVAIQVGIMLVAIIGFASLGTEIVLLLATSRHMQSAADAGVLAAVSARLRGYPADYTQEALALAAAAGFADGVDGTTVQVNSPPTTGNFTAASGAVEVVIAQPQTLPLASVFHPDPFVVRARSVARISGSGSCLLALDPAASGAVSMNGTSIADLLNCSVSVNSSSPQAVSLVGGSVIKADHVSIVGGYALGGGSQIVATSGITTAAAATPDPYAGYVMPAAAPSCIPDPNVKTNRSLPPGTYCAITVSSATLTLSAGNYIIKGGALTVKAGATLTGTGVTIVLAGAAGAYATVSIKGGAILNLTAPTAGATAGLVFFQDRNAPATGTNDLTGGVGQSISGGLYFPNQNVQFAGGSAAITQCTQIVARSVKLTGNATLKLDCAGTGVLPIGGSGGRAAMIE